MVKVTGSLLFSTVSLYDTSSTLFFFFFFPVWLQEVEGPCDGEAH